MKETRILVLVEREEGEIASITLELLHLGRNLADELGGVLCSTVLGHHIGDVADGLGAFCDEVYCIDNPLLAAFRSDLYTHVLEKLCRRLSPGIVLVGHTINNLDLAPRLACRVKGTLVTDCTSVSLGANTEALLCTKPIYGDRANAVFIAEGRPRIVTLRPKSVESIRESGGKGKIITPDILLDELPDNIELLGAVPGESVSLDKADAIVAGGRGVKDEKGIALLEELIDAMKRYFDKVELGASRPLVDAGLLPKNRQLGQTGEKAAPEVYVAVAISGSSQHVSGIVGSKKIVAINKDPEAPIFEMADYGIVGPFETVVPALTGKLKELP